MDVEQVDSVDPQPFQALVQLVLQMTGRIVKSALAGFRIPPDRCLRRNSERDTTVVSIAIQVVADDLFRSSVAIDIRRVDVIDAQLDAGIENRLAIGFAGTLRRPRRKDIAPRPTAETSGPPRPNSRRWIMCLPLKLLADDCRQSVLTKAFLLSCVQATSARSVLRQNYLWVALICIPLYCQVKVRLTAFGST